LKFPVERTFEIKTGFWFIQNICWNKTGFGSKKFFVGIKTGFWFNEILCWNKNRILVQ